MKNSIIKIFSLLFLLLNPSLAFPVSYPGNNNSQYKTQYVGIIVFDGVRKDFADSTLVNGRSLTYGQVNVSPFWGTKPFITVDCHVNIFTGSTNFFRSVRDGNVNNNNSLPGTTREWSKSPTLFELIRYSYGLPRNAVWSFAGKGFINNWSITSADNEFTSVHNPATGVAAAQVTNYSPSSATITSNYYGNSAFPGPDSLIWKTARDTLTTYHPKFFFINFSEFDEFCHGQPNYVIGVGKTAADTNLYIARLDTISQHCMDFADSVWNFIQADTAYANKTTLFITTDHGRHLDTHRAGTSYAPSDTTGKTTYNLWGYMQHGHWDTTSAHLDTTFATACDGCKQIFLQIRGPDKMYRYQGGYDHTNIAPTICQLLGIPKSLGNSRFNWSTVMSPPMDRVFANPAFSRWQLPGNNRTSFDYFRDFLTDANDRPYRRPKFGNAFSATDSLTITGSQNWNILNITPPISNKTGKYTLNGIEVTMIGKTFVTNADTNITTDTLAFYVTNTSDSLSTNPYKFKWGPLPLMLGARIFTNATITPTNQAGLLRLFAHSRNWDHNIGSSTYKSDATSGVQVSMDTTGVGEPLFKTIQFNPPLYYAPSDSVIHIQFLSLLDAGRAAQVIVKVYGEDSIGNHYFTSRYMTAYPTFLDPLNNIIGSPRYSSP